MTGSIFTILVMVAILVYGGLNLAWALGAPHEWDVKIVYERNENEKTVYLFDDHAFFAGISTMKEGEKLAVDLEAKYGRFVIDYEDNYFWPTTACYPSTGPTNKQQQFVYDSFEEINKNVMMDVERLKLESAAKGPNFYKESAYRTAQQNWWKEAEQEYEEERSTDPHKYIHDLVSGACPANALTAENIKEMCAYYPYYKYEVTDEATDIDSFVHYQNYEECVAAAWTEYNDPDTYVGRFEDLSV